MKLARIAATAAMTGVVMAVFTVAPEALAHAPGASPTSAGHGGLIGGVLHPLGGLDHLLALVAAGMLAGGLGGRAALAVPGVFLAALAAGFVAGVEGAALPLGEFAIAASLVFLGSIVALGLRLPLAVAVSLAGLFAVFHGYAHGVEAPVSTEPVVFGLGLITASAFILAAGAAITLRAGRSTAARAGGAAVAGAGLVLALML
ncbi:MAG: HupE/UreJ family protein [Alphaproteobacteria bacterium]